MTDLLEAIHIFIINWLISMRCFGGWLLRAKGWRRAFAPVAVVHAFQLAIVCRSLAGAPSLLVRVVVGRVLLPLIPCSRAAHDTRKR
jgi:hypothetical protein